MSDSAEVFIPWLGPTLNEIWAGVHWSKRKAHRACLAAKSLGEWSVPVHLEFTPHHGRTRWWGWSAPARKMSPPFVRTAAILSGGRMAAEEVATMGWSIGWDSNWKRDIGYGVPATCDHPGCGEPIHRGLSYVCGGEPFGGDEGCGLHFCGKHLWPADEASQLCACCMEGDDPFDPTPDRPIWLAWKLLDDSWEACRRENPEVVLAIARRLGEPLAAWSGT